MNQMTSYDVDKMLAIEQVAHYRRLQAAAAANGNKAEYRRLVDKVDILVTKHQLQLNEHVEVDETK